MPEANVEKRSAADECSDGPAAKKAAKESRACAGVTGTVGQGKDVEEFRNYEDSDRHSVRFGSSTRRCRAKRRGAARTGGSCRIGWASGPLTGVAAWVCRWWSATTR